VPSNETDLLESANATISDENFSTRNSTSLELEADPTNGTESSGDLAKELAQAEQAVISSFSRNRVHGATTIRPSLKLFAAPMKEDSKCETSTITGKLLC
jgi:hypothetical protein